MQTLCETHTTAPGGTAAREQRWRGSSADAGAAQDLQRIAPSRIWHSLLYPQSWHHILQTAAQAAGLPAHLWASRWQPAVVGGWQAAVLQRRQRCRSAGACTGEAAATWFAVSAGSAACDRPKHQAGGDVQWVRAKE